MKTFMFVLGLLVTASFCEADVLQKPFHQGLFVRAPISDGVDTTLGFTVGADNLSQTKVSNNPGFRTHFSHPVEGVDGIIAFVEWQHIQPSSFGEIKDNNIIDLAIQSAESWNISHPESPIKVRIRALPGVHSPQWVKNLAGQVDIDWCKSNCDRNLRTFSIPKFWTDKYRLAWEDFQFKLAAKYDHEPLISDVSISGQGTLHSEVTWRHYSFPHAFKQLVAGGLTFDRDVALWKEDITFMMETWKQTPVEMTFNGLKSYQVNALHEAINLAPNTAVISELLNYMDDESERLNGKKYMVGNHSLGPDNNFEKDRPNDPSHVQYYLSQAQKNGAALYFQTEVHTSAHTAELLEIAACLGSIVVETTQGETTTSIMKPSVQSGRQAIKSNNLIDTEPTKIKVLAQPNTSYGINNTATLYSQSVIAADGLASFKIAFDVIPTTGTQIRANSLGYWGVDNVSFSNNETVGEINNLRVVGFNKGGGCMKKSDITGLAFSVTSLLGAAGNQDKGFITQGSNRVTWQDINASETTAVPGFFAIENKGYINLSRLFGESEVTGFTLGALNGSQPWRVGEIRVAYNSVPN